MYKLRIHRFLFPLKKKWQMLEKKNEQTPYQKYDLQRIVSVRLPLHCLRKKLIPAYCEVRKDGKTVLIAPLLEKKRAKQCREFLSYTGMTGFNIYDFIFDPQLEDEELKDCVLFLAGELGCSTLLLDDLPEGSPLLKAFVPGQTEDMSVECESKENVSIHLDNGYESYFHSLSKQTRQNIRTAYHRMENDGLSYEVEYIFGKKLQRKDLLRILEIYDSRRENRYSVRYSFIRRFYERYLDYSTAYQQKWPDNVYVLLRLNGEIRAFMSGIVFQDGHRALFLRIAMCKEDARYSPGYVMINEMAKEFSKNTAITDLDLSKGTEHYKLLLGGTIYPSYLIKVSM